MHHKGELNLSKENIFKF